MFRLKGLKNIKYKVKYTMTLGNPTCIASFSMLKKKTFENNVKMEWVDGREGSGKREEIRDRPIADDTWAQKLKTSWTIRALRGYNYAAEFITTEHKVLCVIMARRSCEEAILNAMSSAVMTNRIWMRISKIRENLKRWKY